MKHSGTYLDHPALADSDLPKLIRRQQMLARTIAPLERELEPLIARERQWRQVIDRLLVDAGLGHMDAVTCNGLEVTHNKRRGHTTIDADVLTRELTQLGVPKEAVEVALAEATTTGDDVLFATVKPEKGARVTRAA